MQEDIERVLIDRARIAERVESLAAEIAADLRAEAEGGPVEVTLVPILVGSVIFVSDLIRRLPLRMQIRLMSVSSYPGKATASRGARVQEALTTLPEDLSGRHVLVIDDILDSGGTLRLVTDLIGRRNPASVHTCVLLRKQRPEAIATPVDYVAFDIPDEFVVGYGLDFDDYYRNLPDIVTLRSEVVADRPGV
jgi:hypoxanthine phosphoribosyltransferase